MARRTLTVLLLGLTLVAPTPSSAGFPDRVATSSGWTAPLQVRSGDEIYYRCRGSQPGYAVMTYVLHDAQGKLRGGALALWFWDGSDYVVVHANGERRVASHTERTGEPRYAVDLTEDAFTDGVLRSAYAGWGIDMHCTLEVDGQPVASAPLAEDRAAYAFNTDFSGGAAATVLAHPAQTIVGTAVAAGQSLEDETDGFVLGIVNAGPAVMRIVPPQGEPFLLADANVTGFARPGSGAWRYELLMQADARLIGGDPILYVLDLPS